MFAFASPIIPATAGTTTTFILTTTAALTTFIALYTIASFAYCLARNVIHARRTGFPTIVVPWDQNHFLWLVTCVPLRPVFKRWLPARVYGRLVLCIYGHEFEERFRPFEVYAATSSSRDGDQQDGGEKEVQKSYMLVTCGSSEFWTYDSEIAMQILARLADFQQIKISEIFMARFGNNVLMSNGECWARQRRVVAGVINERISKATFVESLRQVEGLIEEVEKGGFLRGGGLINEEGGGGGGGGGDSNRIFDMLRKVTVNVLSGVGMGVRVPWDDIAMEKPRPGFKMNYMEAVRHVMDNVTGPIILPQWFLAHYPSFLPGHRTLRSLSVAVQEFPTHTMAMLDRERERSASGLNKAVEARSNIMSQLLQASSASSKTHFSDEEMMGNLFIFTAAGFDTTANSLSYATVLLARYPHWQIWLQEEVDALIPDRNTPTAELEYTEIHPRVIRVLAFMFETLRLFPPLIHISKQNSTPQIITTSQGRTHWLPAHTQVYINCVCLGLDPAIWRNINLGAGESPSADDELRFRPTRWLVPSPSPTSEEQSQTGSGLDGKQVLYQPPKGTFLPWSAGPRTCPGQKMAQVEFTAVIMGLLRNHRVEAVEEYVGEGRERVEARLDERLRRSFSVMTLQMHGVYDVGGEEEEVGGKGLRVGLRRRRMDR